MSTQIDSAVGMGQLPHACDAAELLAVYSGDAQEGLSQLEAEERLQEQGENALVEPPPPRWWHQLLEQFREVVVGLLLAAAVIAAVLGEWVDMGAILAIVVLNALLGFLQQRKAERALSTLQKLSAPTAKALRNGVIQVVDARQIAVGDCIELESGDHVPADARILHGFGVQAMESALTGESTPVEKEAGLKLPEDTPLGDRTNMLFMGSVISTGKARALVVATGMNTELGRIAQLLGKQSAEPTPLQRRLAQLGRNLVIVCMVLVGIVFALQLFRGGNVLETLHLAVSLAVAAIPEGLPAAVTITLAVGLERLVRRNAIIRKLASVETLGCVTVICSDKTGTLTRNEMTVREVHTLEHSFHVTGSGYNPNGDFLLQPTAEPVDPICHYDLLRTLEISAWCNHAQVIPVSDCNDQWRVVGDPTEGALVVLARKAEIETSSRGELLYEIPFDSDRKAMSVVVRPPEGPPILCMKGAPEVVLAKCTGVLSRQAEQVFTAQARQQVLQRAGKMAGRALRVIAVAYHDRIGAAQGIDAEQNLVFAGLIGMIDPPREEAREAVASCRSAGIRPVMITGDHPATALAIGRELGIAGEDDGVLSGSDLQQLSDRELTDRLSHVPVFARVTAEHKLRLVGLLKQQGHVVAMTGDGVNDGPAVKAADIGIAMGRTGTDVTKQASTMVLADDNFATIVNAVEEGRGIYDNIQKFIQYLLAGNAGKILFMFTAAIIGWPTPLLAIQLLWLNLVTDGLPALGLGMESPEPGIMRRKPRSPHSSLVDLDRLTRIVTHGALTASTALLGFWVVYQGNSDRLAEARVVAFCILAFAQLGYALSCRSEHHTFLSLGLFTNRTFVASTLLSLALQLSIVLFPILHPVFGVEAYPTAWEWLLIATLSLFPVVTLEALKWIEVPSSTLHSLQRH